MKILDTVIKIIKSFKPVNISNEIKKHFSIIITTPEDCLNKVRKRLNVLEKVKS